MEKIPQRILAFVQALTAKQVVLLMASAMIVGATVWVFVRLLGDGEYKMLYSGMAPADAQNLGQTLSAKNISFQISPDGTTVLVRADELDKARLEVSSQGPLASGRMGFELFDKPNWSGSDFSEKVNYQRALEAELECTIATMSGVEAVRVHLVLPRESIFSDRERAAKAAVVLKLRGTRLTDEIGVSVANLVSSAWDDLSPQNVTVVTTDGQMPGRGHGHAPGAESSEDLETTLAERIVRTLAPVVGSEHVKSSVTIDYDQTSGESTQELYDPNNSVVLSSQSSQETSGDLEPGGIPGTASNTPNAGLSSTAAAQAKTTVTSSQGIRSESKTYAVSHTTRHLMEPAGRVKRVAAAILVDDAVESKTDNGKTTETRRKRTPEEMKQIEELAKAAIGFDTQRGDLFSLQNVAFTIPTVDLPPAPGKLQKFVTVAERWTGMLRYVALSAFFLILYLLILNPVKRQVVAILQSPGRPALPASAGNANGGSLGGESVAGGLPDEVGSGASPEVEAAVLLKKRLVDKVKGDPQGASRLIQNWLRQSEAAR